MSLTDLMSNAGLAFYAEVAEVLFFVVFLGITWWVYLPANRDRFRTDARMPLDDYQPVTTHTGGTPDGN